MPLDLEQHLYVGKDFCRHHGWGVSKVIGQTRKPVGPIDPHPTPLKAIEAAERLGEPYCAVRLYSYKGETRTRELIARDDLPIYVGGIPQ